MRNPHVIKLLFSRQNGFTLIETIISVAVLSFSLLLIFSAVQTVVHKHHALSLRLTAYALARGLIEEHRLSPSRDIGEISGEIGDAFSDEFSWVVNITEEPVEILSLSEQFVYHRISVRVQGGAEEKLADLSTLVLSRNE